MNIYDVTVYTVLPTAIKISGETLDGIFSHLNVLNSPCNFTAK